MKKIQIGVEPTHHRRLISVGEDDQMAPNDDTIAEENLVSELRKLEDEDRQRVNEVLHALCEYYKPLSVEPEAGSLPDEGFQECPFCGFSGGKLSLVQSGMLYTDNLYEATVGCWSSCGARVSAQDKDPDIAYEKARKKWNRRSS